MCLTLYLELRVAMDVFDPLTRTKSGNGCVFGPLTRTKSGNGCVWPIN